MSPQPSWRVDLLLQYNMERLA
jgi:hypothetical protein